MLQVVDNFLARQFWRFCRPSLLVNFWANNSDSNESILRDIFAMKTLRSATERAITLLRALRWHPDNRYSAWPWSAAAASDYVATFNCKNGGASATTSAAGKQAAPLSVQQPDSQGFVETATFHHKDTSFTQRS